MTVLTTSTTRPLAWHGQVEGRRMFFVANAGVDAGVRIGWHQPAPDDDVISIMFGSEQVTLDFTTWKAWNGSGMSPARRRRGCARRSRRRPRWPPPWRGSGAENGTRGYEGANVTVTLSAPFVMVHNGCGIRFRFDNGDETELLLGELPNEAIELSIEAEALRELVQRGSEALHQMDSLRARSGDDER